MDTREISEVLRKSRELLLAGDTQGAYGELRAVLDYPGEAQGAQWTEVVELFAKISERLAGAEFAAKVRAAQKGSVQALYDLGYALIDEKQPWVAASFLLRAHQQQPGNPGILEELVAALERSGWHSEACRLLKAAPELLARTFLLRYLLGFNALACGDLATARAQVPTLRSSDSAEDAFLASALTGMVARADAVAGLKRAHSLDTRDLRGWHFVFNGTFLLHTAELGYDEGMNGRYAFIQDSPRLCLDGLRKLASLLAALGHKPPRVLAAPGRDSGILAAAAARSLDLPLAPFAPGQPGLVVAYDLDGLEGEAMKALRPHAPGQVLWSHASCWTDVFPYAPDFTTFLYQSNRSPWGPRLAIDPESKTVKDSGPDSRPEAELVAEVLAAEPEPSLPGDLDDLLALAQGVRHLAASAAPGALRDRGDRRRNFGDSPVPSSRFA